jgi:hypothetical protein
LGPFARCSAYDAWAATPEDLSARILSIEASIAEIEDLLAKALGS